MDDAAAGSPLCHAATNSSAASVGLAAGMIGTVVVVVVGAAVVVGAVVDGAVDDDCDGTTVGELSDEHAPEMRSPTASAASDATRLRIRPT